MRVKPWGCKRPVKEFHTKIASLREICNHLSDKLCIHPEAVIVLPITQCGIIILNDCTDYNQGLQGS